LPRRTRLDPVGRAKALSKVLVLQGGRDIQVSPLHDYLAFKLALPETAALRLYPKANHLFVDGRGSLRARRICAASPRERERRGRHRRVDLHGARCQAGEYRARMRPVNAQPSGGPAPRRRPLRWVLALVANQHDGSQLCRSADAGGARAVGDLGFHISDTMYGWLASAFSIAYLIGAPLAAAGSIASARARPLDRGPGVVMQSRRSTRSRLDLPCSLRCGSCSARRVTVVSRGVADGASRAARKTSRARYGILSPAARLAPWSRLRSPRESPRSTAGARRFSGPRSSSRLGAPLVARRFHAGVARAPRSADRSCDGGQSRESITYTPPCSAPPCWSSRPRRDQLHPHWGSKYLVREQSLTQAQVGAYLWLPPLVFDLGSVISVISRAAGPRAGKHDGVPDRSWLGSRRSSAARSCSSGTTTRGRP